MRQITRRLDNETATNDARQAGIAVDRLHRHQAASVSVGGMGTADLAAAAV